MIRILSGERTSRRHRAASAEAMHKAIIALTPEFIRGPASEASRSLSILFRTGFFGGRRWALPPLLFTRMNSGVSITRAIHITALKRGESEKVNSMDMRAIARFQTRR